MTAMLEHDDTRPSFKQKKVLLTIVKDGDRHEVQIDPDLLIDYAVLLQIDKLVGTIKSLPDRKNA